MNDTKKINNWTVKLDTLQAIKKDNMKVKIEDKFGSRPVTLDNLFNQSIERNARGAPVLYPAGDPWYPEHLTINYVDHDIIKEEKDIAVSLGYKGNLLSYRTDDQVAKELDITKQELKIRL